jgi:DNA polymerase I-like protein with 3'-5' exonuclease and polymerase domains
MSNPKDILNRLIQSSAHDCLNYFSIKLYDALGKSGIPYYTVLPDIHDEGIYECEDRYVDKFIKVLYNTLDELNKELDLFIPLEIQHNVIKKLSELK